MGCRFDIKSAITYEGTEYLVSTVDLGISHGFLLEKEEHYETIIFHKDTGNIRYINRFFNVKEAIETHEDIIDNIELYIR